MNAEEYTVTQAMLQGVAALVGALDLYSFLKATDRAEALGPILNPTLYHKAADKLQNVRDLAEAALVFQREVNRQVALSKASTGPE